MDIFWTIFVVVHAVSLLFLIISINFLIHYIRRYKMEESGFTMLFGFIRLEHIIPAYIIAILLFISGSTLFAFYLMQK